MDSKYTYTAHVLCRVSTQPQAHGIDGQYERIKEHISTLSDRHDQFVLINHSVVGSISKFQNDQIVSILKQIKKENDKNHSKWHRSILVVEDITRLLRNVNQVHQIVECLYDFQSHQMNLIIVNTTSASTPRSIGVILHGLYPEQKYIEDHEEQQKEAIEYFTEQQLVVYKDDQVTERRKSIESNLMQYLIKTDGEPEWINDYQLYECVYRIQQGSFNGPSQIVEQYMMNPQLTTVSYLMSYEAFLMQCDISMSMLLEKIEQGKYNIIKVVGDQKMKKQKAFKLIQEVLEKEQVTCPRELIQMIYEQVGYKMSPKQLTRQIVLHQQGGVIDQMFNLFVEKKKAVRYNQMISYIDQDINFTAYQIAKQRYLEYRKQSKQNEKVIKQISQLNIKDDKEEVKDAFDVKLEEIEQSDVIHNDLPDLVQHDDMEIEQPINPQEVIQSDGQQDAQQSDQEIFIQIEEESNVQ